LSDLRGLLARATLVHTEAIDYEEAATFYRVCRRSGENVRKLVDCLIASIAVLTDSSNLHCDTDFDVLARHTALQIDPPRSRS
jgi:predicted nucleic acid-binding protein